MENNYEIHRMGAVWASIATQTHLSYLVTSEDIRTFKLRVEAEGIQFLTVTLPTLGKSLDRAFRTGFLEIPNEWVDGSERAYPLFLSQAWRRLFNEDGTGKWLETTEGYDPTRAHALATGMDDAVLAIRQLSLLFYKYEQPWTREQAIKSFTSFKDVEQTLWEDTQTLLAGGLTHILIDGRSVSTYLARAERLIGRLLRDFDPYQVNPRYGTGATAVSGQSQWARWQNPRSIEQLNRLYPYDEWFFSGVSGIESHLKDSKWTTDELVETVSRVALVPKDSRGPRQISAEVPELMHIQLGQATVLVDAMESYGNVRREVSTKDQARNKELARTGSLFNHRVTLDLEKASDRNSHWLVTKLFPENWVDALSASRAEWTVLPTGEEIPLVMFAPMGSATCFPVETLVFWALANAARHDWNEKEIHDYFFNRSGPDEGEPPVSVYGDDIIVRPEDAGRLIELLTVVGFRVNENKSFRDGPFRESCGGDYFLGKDVVPIRCKNPLGGQDIKVVYDFNVLCNNIYVKYGAGRPELIHFLRQLNHSMFGLRQAIVPKREEPVYQCYVLTDVYWDQYETGEHPVASTPPARKRVSGSKSNVIKGSDWRPRATKVRRGQPDPLKPDYGQLCIRTLVERPDKADRDVGWGSVLRWFCLQAKEVSANIYSLRQRVHHKPAWAEIERVRS